MTDETNPADFSYKRTGDHSHINGWGIDVDQKNDPTYPIKKRTDEEIHGYTWERPPLQPVEIEVLHSVERPNITAVFGTSMPPKGLSGKIRRQAFKYSESSYGHWLPLIIADRIDEIEGIVDDIKTGHIPDFFAEHGWKAEWRYNKKNFIIKSAAVALATVGVFVLLSGKNGKSRKQVE